MVKPHSPSYLAMRKTPAQLAAEAKIVIHRPKIHTVRVRRVITHLPARPPTNTNVLKQSIMTDPAKSSATTEPAKQSAPPGSHSATLDTKHAQAQAGDSALLAQNVLSAEGSTKTAVDEKGEKIEKAGVALTDGQLAILTAAFDLLKVKGESDEAKALRLQKERDADVQLNGRVVTDSVGVTTSLAVCNQVTEGSGVQAEKVWRFYCPQCKGLMEMKESELACKIVRHGAINPHANQAECERFAQESLLRFKTGGGCGVALRFDNGTVHIVGYNT